MTGDLPASRHFFNHRGDEAEAGWQLLTLPVDSAAPSVDPQWAIGSLTHVGT